MMGSEEEEGEGRSDSMEAIEQNQGKRRQHPTTVVVVSSFLKRQHTRREKSKQIGDLLGVFGLGFSVDGTVDGTIDFRHVPFGSTHRR